MSYKLDDVARKIIVMEAFREGRKIEARLIDDEDELWVSAPNPSWNWHDCEYRIKPEEPQLVPFTFETMPFPCVVRHIGLSNASECLVTAKCINYISLDGIGIPDVISYAELSDRYEWRPLDSHNWKPCMKKMEV